MVCVSMLSIACNLNKCNFSVGLLECFFKALLWMLIMMKMKIVVIYKVIYFVAKKGKAKEREKMTWPGSRYLPLCSRSTNCGLALAKNKIMYVCVIHKPLTTHNLLFGVSRS